MYALRGQGARLQRALINHLLEQNEEAGYESWYLPNLVRAEAMFGVGPACPSSTTICTATPRRTSTWSPRRRSR